MRNTEIKNLSPVELKTNLLFLNHILKKEKQAADSLYDSSKPDEENGLLSEEQQKSLVLLILSDIGKEKTGEGSKQDNQTTRNLSYAKFKQILDASDPSADLSKSKEQKILDSISALQPDDQGLSCIKEEILSNWRSQKLTQTVPDAAGYDKNSERRQTGAQVEGIASYYQVSDSSIQKGRDLNITLDTSFYEKNSLFNQDESLTDDNLAVKKALEKTHLKNLFDAAVESVILNDKDTVNLRKLSSSQDGKEPDYYAKKEENFRSKNSVKKLAAIVRLSKLIDGAPEEGDVQKEVFEIAIKSSLQKLGVQGKESEILEKFRKFDELYQDKMKEDGIYSGRTKGLTIKYKEEGSEDIKTLKVVDNDGNILDEKGATLCTYDQMMTGDDSVALPDIERARKNYYDGVKEFGSRVSYFPPELLQKMELKEKTFITQLLQSSSEKIEEEEKEKVITYKKLTKKRGFAEKSSDGLLETLNSFIAEAQNFEADAARYIPPILSRSSDAADGDSDTESPTKFERITGGKTIDTDVASTRSPEKRLPVTFRDTLTNKSGEVDSSPSNSSQVREMWRNNDKPSNVVLRPDIKPESLKQQLSSNCKITRAASAASLKQSKNTSIAP